MEDRSFDQLLCSPSASRPVVLEGRWLARAPSRRAWSAVDPVSVLEGSAEALEEIPAWLASHLQQFPHGAAIGFLSYELARFLERLPLSPDPQIPDLSFAYYPRIGISACPEAAGGQRFRMGMRDAREYFDELRFTRDVENIRRYIAAGDIYQANLTQQVTVPLEDQSAESIYERLGKGGASFRAFLKTPHGTIVSDSPERFFHVSGGRILTSPIKGTMARSADPARDARQAAHLLASGKDRAENLMIVDLLRNDLGRICCYESIQTRLWELDVLPHLYHLVSDVQGRLKPGVGVLEILRALFPCGSITGAPKIRAMEILAEIEQRRRGVSMGAIGIIRGVPGTESCEMDFSVAIRTMLVRSSEAVFNVGGGIVYDSVPGAEFEEMVLKASPLLDALASLEVVERRAVEAHALRR
jgi:para-aminobenzoate synthetase component 1